MSYFLCDCWYVSEKIISRQVKKDDYLLVDGLHEALVSEEVWEQAQVKVAAQAKKYEKVNRDKREKIHLLSGILKCPVCGAGMYGNVFFADMEVFRDKVIIQRY